ncbi:dnaJ homolog subfamily C member 17 isoform X1 [Balaenoptera acutorostrata]|uniref:DnaJ homolog subfamily C member 17 isoform X1 n=1 Tax=Balaenoptera acutorostrata TaxID=9767 RepID=A0ABM3TBQ8_BALAC|nr:dnaJ homolog subfamily C member 17 isoform X1 [Balaenoptera acutorostrata]
MAVAKELLQMDLYALLGIEEEATDKEMKKAYRQKALSCHPDKNPDNPRAAELFHQLSQALEVLTDAAARAAYDKVRKARKQAAERTQKLDERRKKVKLDLEARERQAQAHGSDEEEEEESRSTGTLEQEIRRLREEGSRQLEEQQRVIQEQIRQEREQRLRGMAENPESKGTPKLKVSPADLQATSHHLLSAEQMIPWAQLKWKSKKEAKSQGGYSRDVLLRLFQKYGEVLNLVLSSKKAGTAVVEFATIKAAELAVQNEVGLVDNPLKISWLEGRPQSTMGPNHPGLSQIASGQERTSGSQGPAFLWGCLGLTWGPASGEGAGPSLGGEPGWEGNSPRSCRGLGERRRRGAVGKGRGIWAE